MKKADNLSKFDKGAKAALCGTFRAVLRLARFYL